MAKNISNDSTQESDVKRRLEEINNVNNTHDNSKLTLDLTNNYIYEKQN